MKKTLSILTIIICIVLGITTLAACGGEKNVLVVTRESGSGTRDAFDGLIKNSAGDTLAKKADGTKFDAVVKTADLQSSTGNVMTKVASAKSAIGYISLGSLNDTVKALTIGGIDASAENVLNNTYKLQRPFVVMTNVTATPTAATADFLRYLNSKQAQNIVETSKYVRQDNAEGEAYDYTAPTSALNGTITIKGSTSVDPLMDKLIKDYLAKGGNKVSDITFAKDAQGSAQGVAAAIADTTGSVIGISSSAVKPNEIPLINYFNIALDAVAVIVNKTNTISNLTVAQLYSIYTGETLKFSSIAQ